MGEPEELKAVARIFQLCCGIKSDDVSKNIKATSLGQATQVAKPSNIVEAANKFIKSVSEQLIVYYCALSETISSKQQVATQQTGDKEEKEKQQLKELEVLIASVYETMAREVAG